MPSYLSHREPSTAVSSKYMLTDQEEGPLREVGWKLLGWEEPGGRVRVGQPEPASVSFFSP